MPLPWIKLWVEALDDPKLTRLPLAERGAWWGILKLAHKCGAGGKLTSGGVGLTMDEIADGLHIKTGEDRAALESMIAQMEKRGSLKWNESALTIIHYDDRQRVAPSSQPEAVADRVRRHRERVGELGVISKLYEENIGQLTPMVAERLKDIASKYPPGWFKEALQEAIGAGVRKLNYIEAILERWQIEGFKSLRKGEPRGDPRRPGQLPTDEELDKQEKAKGV
ncbi:hypothetical protein ES703_94406 [subsurface metagenome]